MGSFNTFGKTSKDFGSGRNIWNYVGAKFPVGGVLDKENSVLPQDASALGIDPNVIPAGTMAILDTANATVKVICIPTWKKQVYAQNTYAIKDGVLYKSKAETSAAWTASEWDEVGESDETLKKLEEVNGLTEDDIYLEDEDTIGTAAVVYSGVVYQSRLVYGVTDAVLKGIGIRGLKGV